MDYKKNNTITSNDKEYIIVYDKITNSNNCIKENKINLFEKEDFFNEKYLKHKYLHDYFDKFYNKTNDIKKEKNKFEFKITALNAKQYNNIVKKIKEIQEKDNKKPDNLLALYVRNKIWNMFNVEKPEQAFVIKDENEIDFSSLNNVFNVFKFNGNQIKKVKSLICKNYFFVKNEWLCVESVNIEELAKFILYNKIPVKNKNLIKNKKFHIKLETENSFEWI